MAKVDIDTDLMNNELLPVVADEVKHMNNALSNAQTISFPDSGFGWGNIINNISECVTLSNKYTPSKAAGKKTTVVCVVVGGK